MGQAQPDPLTQSLDALYGRDPDAAVVQHVQAKLRRTLAREGSNMVYYDSVSHPAVGTVFVAVNERGLVALDFGLSERDFVAHVQHRTRATLTRSHEQTREALRQVREYLSDKRTSFDLPIDLSRLSDFQRRVLTAALKIPRGQYRTYHDVAKAIGRPQASRAVGQALGHNPIPIVIPCHRVLGSDGSLHGYSGGGGLKTKAWLLQLEGARPPVIAKQN
jgi:methylated-DNA-[protein]-cysteine S-methyltransferase